MPNLLQDLQRMSVFAVPYQARAAGSLPPTSSIERTDWGRSTLRAAFCRVVGLLNRLLRGSPCKWDGEGTFAGKGRNDGVAPKNEPDIWCPTLTRRAPPT